MPRLGFKPTIAVFEGAKIFYALYRVTTVIGITYFYNDNIKEDEFCGAACKWKMRNSYKVLVRKPEENALLPRLRRAREDNIKIDLQEMENELVE
jgi:hypothetical protein